MQLDAEKSGAATGLAKAFAPEEIRPGDFVVRRYEVFEYPPFLWGNDATLIPRDQPLRMRFVPGDEPTPLKVAAVCSTCVWGKTPTAGKTTLDVRICRPAGLDADYARAAWKACRGTKRRKRRRRKRN